MNPPTAATDRSETNSIISAIILPLLCLGFMGGIFFAALMDSVCGRTPSSRYFSYASHTVFGSPNITMRPLSSHSTLLHCRLTLPMEWDTISPVVLPSDRIFCICSRLFFLKSPSPTAKTSSKMMISGSTRLAIAKAILDFMPEDRVRKGLSSKSRISAKSIISSYFESINSFE